MIWRNNRPVDLNTLVDGLPSGQRLELASAVNDDGLIVGRSYPPTHCEASQAYLLVPTTS